MQLFNDNGEIVEISQEDQMWLDDTYFGKQQAKLPFNAPKAALLYRVSTKGQVDHDDIPLQKIACRKHAHQYGWRVVMEKAEKGISGSKVSATKRDAIQELKNEAGRGTFNILLVYMFDRLGRIESETPFVLEWFVQNGIEMWSTHEGQQKIESHGDKLMNYIRFWQAAGESEKTSMRTRDRLRQIASSGHYTGGTVPYGYRLVDKGRKNKRDKTVFDLEIDPIEGPIVQELFEKIIREGYSCHRLAKMLDERGLKTHSGVKFQTNHILRIIRHEGYTGYIITKEARSGFLPDLELVSKDMFDRANKIVESTRKANADKRNTAWNSESDMLLTGNVFCGCCGMRMTGYHQKERRSGGTYKVVPKYLCYAQFQKLRDCNGQKMFKAEVVDEIVENIAHELFQTFRDNPYDESIEREMKRRQKMQADRERDLQAVVVRCKKNLDNYDDELGLVLEGKSSFTKESLARAIAKAEAKLSEAQEALRQARQEKLDEAEQNRKITQFFDDFKGWVEEYDTATVERKRMILANLFERVEVERGYKVRVKVNISYRQFFEIVNQAEVT